MENVKATGIYFNARDIRNVVESNLDWAEVADDQIFCVPNVMNDKTPIGTSIMIGVDGIKCKEGSKSLKLILSSGIYEIEVKTKTENDAVELRLPITYPIHGTYGQTIDGRIDILTDEEKEFSRRVKELLGNRKDNFAEMFNAVNVREIGGRGLILLEKIKSEIKNDMILCDSDVTPAELIATYVELTQTYINANCEIEKLTAKVEASKDLLKMEDADSRMAKKFERDIKTAERKIAANEKIAEFCDATIKAAVLPVINS